MNSGSNTAFGAHEKNHGRQTPLATGHPTKKAVAVGLKVLKKGYKLFASIVGLRGIRALSGAGIF